MSSCVNLRGYRCLAFDQLCEGEYALRPLCRQDMLPIMAWRNAQLDVLRQKKPLTEVEQRNYWERVIEPSFEVEHPCQLLFTYLHRDEPVGYGGLVHISWEDRRAEVSFLVEPERAARPDAYAEAFAAWLELMARVAFQRLGFQRLFTETYDIRPHHIRILEAAGFVCEGRLRRHVIVNGRPVDSLLHGRLNPVGSKTP